MDEDKYARHVELLCPTCGGSQFEHGDDIDNDDAIVRCIGCDRTLAKSELIAENAENINEHVQEIGKEVVKDLQKELKKMFKRTFPR